MNTVTELAHHLVDKVAELEVRLFVEATAHQRTIEMLAAVARGDVPAEALEVTATGWALKPPPVEEPDVEGRE